MKYDFDVCDKHGKVGRYGTRNSLWLQLDNKQN